MNKKRDLIPYLFSHKKKKKKKKSNMVIDTPLKTYLLFLSNTASVSKATRQEDISKRISKDEKDKLL